MEQEQKTKRKASAAHMRATKKYEQANYDKVMVRLKKGMKDRIQATGNTLNGFIVQAVYDQLETIERRKELENMDDLPPLE